MDSMTERALRRAAEQIAGIAPPRAAPPAAEARPLDLAGLLELAARLLGRLTALAAVFYALGYIIVNSWHAQLGFRSFDVSVPGHLLAGIGFVTLLFAPTILAALVVLPAYLSTSIARVAPRDDETLAQIAARLPGPGASPARMARAILPMLFSPGVLLALAALYVVPPAIALLVIEFAASGLRDAATGRWFPVLRGLSDSTEGVVLLGTALVSSLMLALFLIDREFRPALQALSRSFAARLERERAAGVSIPPLLDAYARQPAADRRPVAAASQPWALGGLLFLGTVLVCTVLWGRLLYPQIDHAFGGADGGEARVSLLLRVRLETHRARAMRRTRSMTEAA